MTQKHGVDVYPHVVEKAQPWCEQCNLPLDICRGHDDPITQPSPTVEVIVRRWMQLDGVQECDLAAALVRADVRRADGLYVTLGMALEAVTNPRYVGDAAAVMVPLAQVSIGADAIPGDVAEALFAKHSAGWCERLIDEMLTLLEVAKDKERHARIWDKVTQEDDMVQLRVAQ